MCNKYPHILIDHLLAQIFYKHSPMTEPAKKERKFPSTFKRFYSLQGWGINIKKTAQDVIHLLTLCSQYFLA